jgi:hypothetical protein
LRVPLGRAPVDPDRVVEDVPDLELPDDVRVPLTDVPDRLACPDARSPPDVRSPSDARDDPDETADWTALPAAATAEETRSVTGRLPSPLVSAA